MSEMQNKLGITVFVSEIKREENYEISKASQRRQTFLVIFCRSGSVA